jgi:hypothetical protein
MDDRMPHYLRFARTLALATTLALPACSDGGDSSAADDQGDATGSTTTSAGTGASTTPSATPTVATVPTTRVLHDQGAYGAGGKVSGPLPPPEMPASMA